MSVIRQVAAKTKPVLDQAADLLFPPRCPCCKAMVQGHGSLCSLCWSSLRFITEPYCGRCGHPFDYAVGGDMLCGRCIDEFPSFASARSALCYDEHSRHLVLGLKYADRTDHVPILARWLARTAETLPSPCDVIVPVPLHIRRLIGRRFNQALLLAQALSSINGVKVLSDGLVKRRHTEAQSGLSRAQRLQNVKGAFVVPGRRSEEFKGLRVLLLDDVMTTMATVSSCTSALLDAGAKEVHVLTLARTVHDN